MRVYDQANMQRPLPAGTKTLQVLDGVSSRVETGRLLELESTATPATGCDRCFGVLSSSPLRCATRHALRAHERGVEHSLEIQPHETLELNRKLHRAPGFEAKPSHLYVRLLRPEGTRRVEKSVTTQFSISHAQKNTD